VDWVWLVPVDFGSAFISSKTSATDVVFVDGRSELRALALLNTSSVIQSYPDAQGGDPPQVHPEGTRLSFASDDGAADIADGWTMSITYLPRYLSVAGT
jgi:alpha-ketoglutarate-dependent taurine dioxygenase